MKNSILILAFLLSLNIAKAQLGNNQGDSYGISTFAGNSTTVNNIMHKVWLYRNAPGNDWSTASIHDGIAVDNSFLQPGLNTRAWWQRNPHTGEQQWGHVGQSWLTLSGGKLGIGTASPQTGIQMGDTNNDVTVKQIFIPGTYNFENMRIGQIGNGNMVMEFVNHVDFTRSYGIRWLVNVDIAAGLQLQYATEESQQSDLDYKTGFFMSRYGNVGIGTTSPDEKLAVNGKIHAREVKVDLNIPGPDYVFEADYELATLTDLQNYIAKHKHLPEVPSAKEMELNGINLSDMNMLLLKKVEELTLHLIEKDKEIAEVKTEQTAAREEVSLLIKRLQQLEAKRQ